MRNYLYVLLLAVITAVSLSLGFVGCECNDENTDFDMGNLSDCREYAALSRDYCEDIIDPNISDCQDRFETKKCEVAYYKELSRCENKHGSSERADLYSCIAGIDKTLIDCYADNSNNCGKCEEGYGLALDRCYYGKYWMPEDDDTGDDTGDDDTAFSK